MKFDVKVYHISHLCLYRNLIRPINPKFFPQLHQHDRSSCSIKLCLNWIVKLPNRLKTYDT